MLTITFKRGIERVDSVKFVVTMKLSNSSGTAYAEKMNIYSFILHNSIDEMIVAYQFKSSDCLAVQVNSMFVYLPMSHWLNLL